MLLARLTSYLTLSTLSLTCVCGPSVAIIEYKLCTRTCACILHTYTDFTFLPRGLRCASFSCCDIRCLPCCFLWSQESYYSTVDTDGSSSAPPRVEVVSGWYGKIISCRAGGSARIVEKLQSWHRGGSARIYILLGAPAVAK